VLVGSSASVGESGDVSVSSGVSKTSSSGTVSIETGAGSAQSQ
jgi:hypothetical protein